MKHLLYMITIVLVAAAVGACEDVVLPDSQVNIEETATDTTSGNEDTTEAERVWKALDADGPIVKSNPNVELDIRRGFVLVVWETGTEERTVWGRGTVIKEGKGWRVTLNDKLPERYWVKPQQRLSNQQPAPPGRYGLAHIVIANTDLDDGTVISGNLPVGVKIWGQLDTHWLVYLHGPPGADLLPEWLQPFSFGYRMALPADGGIFIPDDGVEKPYQLTITIR